MIENNKRPKLVGNFIRRRREELGLSQRELGLRFTPPVTTQFISNIERGVTPLPPAHVPILTKILGIHEAELMTLLEREYTLKLTGRIGGGNGEESFAPVSPILTVSNADFDFIKKLYEAYQQADMKTKQAFASVCENLLSVRRDAHDASEPTNAATN